MLGTSSDVVRARNKRGIMVYKGTSQKGIEFLGKVIGGPWAMSKDIFVECLGEDTILRQAAEQGITVTENKPAPPPKVDVSKFTEF